MCSDSDYNNTHYFLTRLNKQPVWRAFRFWDGGMLIQSASITMDEHCNQEAKGVHKHLKCHNISVLSMKQHIWPHGQQSLLPNFGIHSQWISTILTLSLCFNPDSKLTISKWHIVWNCTVPLFYCLWPFMLLYCTSTFYSLYLFYLHKVTLSVLKGAYQ